MSAPRISYYAHHVGSGHLRHARRIIDASVFEVQVTSTGPNRGTLLPAGTNYVSLTADVHPEQTNQPAAGGYLHYAPVGRHITERFATLNQAWKRFAPDLVMVDVSVEVALFAKLSGYRVAMRRMPGKRSDKAHAMAYGIVDALFAYYPQELEDAGHLERYAHKSHYLAVPRPATNLAESQDSSGSADAGTLPGKVVVQTSLGSSIGQADIVRAAACASQWSWEVLGSVNPDGSRIPENLRFHGVVPDPAPFLAQATVVITSSGHNAVSAAAACGRPVLLIPEERPFDEQRCYASMLQRATGCLMLDSWQSPANWDLILEQTAQTDSFALARALFIDPEEFTGRLRSMAGDLVAGISRC